MAKAISICGLCAPVSAFLQQSAWYLGRSALRDLALEMDCIELEMRYEARSALS